MNAADLPPEVPRPTIRFSREGSLNGHTHMARDCEILERAEAGESWCRVYGWDGPWVSLGRFQSADRDLVSPLTTNWVIRPTGGKAVLHGHDITVALALPLSVLGVGTRSLKSVYRVIVQPIVSALRACGVSATLAEGTRHSGRGALSADCFAYNSPNDVVDEATGQKVCGCALRLTDSAVLVQASIPNGQPLLLAETVIRNAALCFREWDSSHFADALEEQLTAIATLERDPERFRLGSTSIAR